MDSLHLYSCFNNMSLLLLKSVGNVLSHGLQSSLVHDIYIPYQSQICCKVASLRDHHNHFFRRIKLILRGHMTAVRHRIGGGGVSHIPGRGWWPGGGSWFLWTHGSYVTIYCPHGLSLWHRPFWWDVHGLPQLLVETSVLGVLSSLSPGCGQFHRHTGQGILDTGFHRRHHTFCDQVSCLWGGLG